MADNWLLTFLKLLTRNIFLQCLTQSRSSAAYSCPFSGATSSLRWLMLANVELKLPRRPVVSVEWQLTDCLSNRVHVICDLQLRHVFMELLGQLLGGEAHGVDVVGPHAQRVRRRLHHLQRGSQAVVDVHHGQLRVGFQVALELARFEGVVEDLDRVVWSEMEATKITCQVCYKLTPEEIYE